jgi:Tol biopolymer transport system component
MSTTDTFDLLFYSWSPDGSQIAFQRAPTADGPRFIHVVSAAGGEARAVTSGESVGAYWSPDGRSIAFLDGSDPAGATLNVVGSDGAGLRTLSDSGSGAFRWSPDGGKILLATEEGSVIVDVLGGPAENLGLSNPTLPDWQRLAPAP